MSSGRIEFVILPTSSSSPVAPHPASRRRSYLRLSRPGPTPSEDSHLTDSVRSQAHWNRSRRKRLRPKDRVGARGLTLAPPSEPDRQFSRIRLSRKAAQKLSARI
jgi:hypothetical protein